MEKRIVTEEDLAANPELADQGIKVGDEIEVPAVPETDGKETKTKKTVVEFVKHFMPYAKGDVAGFDKKEADKLIELKVAKLVK